MAGCKKDDDDNSGSGGEDGDLIVRLTWNQADADLDLDLTGPNNLSVGPFSPQHSGDDLTGPGDETIEFMNDAPDGNYEVVVEWFDGQGDVSYTLLIQGADNGRTFNETIDFDVDIDRFTFTKSGGRISF